MNTDIAKGLEPLFEEARERGLWFFCHYQQIWFSPDELERQHAEGKFRWGAINWQLRDPEEHVSGLVKARDAAESELDAFLKRLDD